MLADVRRERYLAQLARWSDAPVVTVLRGVRRCGKSVLLQQYAADLRRQGVPGDRVILINFESLANAHLATYQALYDHLMNWAGAAVGRVHILLDEIQLVDQWEKAVNSLRVDLDADIVITGSNAWLLSNDLATLLTGRYVELDIYPLSFAEHIDFSRALGRADDVATAFADYLQAGGMPGVHQVAGTDAAMTYLHDVSNSILLKDVVARNKLRDVDLLERLLAFLMSNIGQTFSANKVSGFMKNQRRSLGSETIYNYLHALVDACLIHKAERFDIKGRRTLETQEKYFIADHGFVHSWLGYRPQEIPGFLENIVYMELRRRGYGAHIGKQSDREIDFVADRAGERIYLQVCYVMPDQTTIDREFAPLETIRDNYRKIVLSMDPGPPSQHNGIQRRYLPEFLLDDQWGISG